MLRTTRRARVDEFRTHVPLHGIPVYQPRPATRHQSHQSPPLWVPRSERAWYEHPRQCAGRHREPWRRVSFLGAAGTLHTKLARAARGSVGAPLQLVAVRSRAGFRCAPSSSGPWRCSRSERAPKRPAVRTSSSDNQPTDHSLQMMRMRRPGRLTTILPGTSPSALGRHRDRSTTQPNCSKLANDPSRARRSPATGLPGS